MNEEIKDPNQLDLFEGIVLTTEQQKQVNYYIDSINKSTNYQKHNVQQIEQLLVETGFKVGIDFENTFKSSLETRTVKIGYGSNQFETEVTAEFHSGNINLLGMYFNKSMSKPEQRKFGVDISNGKLQSATIQDQYRFIKPTTLLEKLRKYNETQEYTYNEYVKRNSLKDNVIEKYTKLYPNATVEVKNEYSKYSGSFQVIEVKFQSGSYVQFTLDTYNQAERLYKKYDAQFEKLSSDELLERFSKQEALK